MLLCLFIKDDQFLRVLPCYVTLFVYLRKNWDKKFSIDSNQSYISKSLALNLKPNQSRGSASSLVIDLSIISTLLYLQFRSKIQWIFHFVCNSFYLNEFKIITILNINRMSFFFVFWWCSRTKMKADCVVVGLVYGLILLAAEVHGNTAPAFLWSPHDDQYALFLSFNKALDSNQYFFYVTRLGSYILFAHLISFKHLRITLISIKWLRPCVVANLLEL